MACRRITSIVLRANYRGPAKSVQAWTWQIFDWVHQAYVNVGDNYLAPPHGPWTILSFNIGGNNLANYVDGFGEGCHIPIPRATATPIDLVTPDVRQIRVRLISNNAADDAEIDYEALTITTVPAPKPISQYPNIFPLRPRSFYVSTTGNDANPGTITRPWRTISKAASTVGPGSTVYVRAGVYNERVIVKVSGGLPWCGALVLACSPAVEYIQFQSYPGETAIVDGTGIPVPPVVDTPTGLIQITNRSYIIFKDFEIRNFKSNTPDAFPAGISITGAGSHIQILHNRIHDIGNGIYGAHGLAVYGTRAPDSINHLTIDGNELFNLVLGQSESMALNGNVQFWTVTNNIVHDNDNIGIDAVGFEQTAPDPIFDQARDGYMSGNLVYNISDNNNPAYPANDNSAGGIYVDGGAHITIERNILHDNNIGFEAASEHKGRASSYVIFRDNLVYLSTGPGISIGGYAAPGTPGFPPDCCGSTDNTAIVNNTLFQNDSLQTGSGEFQIQYFPNDGSVSNNIFENNILMANSQGQLISNPFTNPVVNVDYNLYYAPNGDPNNNSWQWNKVTYGSFSGYQAASGNDANSVFGDPLFLSLSPVVLWPAFTSPAVGAGVDLGSWILGTLDAAGFPRIQGSGVDIGAYEQ